jgi:hypothetical protein
MKRQLLLFSFLSFLMTNDCFPENKKTALPLLNISVGYVSDVNAADGCGGYFYWPGEEKKQDAKSIFTWNAGEQPWMNLNGRDVQLKLVKSTESEENGKKGGRYYEIYQAGKMTIRVDYHVTWTCEADMPKSESCEVTHYDLKITFTQNDRQKTIHAKGDFGC